MLKFALSHKRLALESFQKAHFTEEERERLKRAEGNSRTITQIHTHTYTHYTVPYKFGQKILIKDQYSIPFGLH